jgi:hypothetical protein
MLSECTNVSLDKAREEARSWYFGQGEVQDSKGLGSR